MYIVIKVITPNKLDRNQKDLIKELSNTDLETGIEFSKFNKYMKNRR